MKLTIHGPNLIDQSKGDFHVHAAGCRDNHREVRMNGSEHPWTLEADSAQAVVEAIYSDHIAERQAGDPYSTWQPYLEGIAFFPCVKDLPNERQTQGVCARCDQSISLAGDGAWEDESGACGCGDAEHEPA
jgi:hypothetical protein